MDNRGHSGYPLLDPNAAEMKTTNCMCRCAVHLKCTYTHHIAYNNKVMSDQVTGSQSQGNVDLSDAYLPGQMPKFVGGSSKSMNDDSNGELHRHETPTKHFTHEGGNNPDGLCPTKPAHLKREELGYHAGIHFNETYFDATPWTDANQQARDATVTANNRPAQGLYPLN
jgi:hypothetical protein